MEKSTSSHSLVNLFTLLLGAVAAWLVARAGATLSGQLAAVFAVIGTVIAGFSAVQLWLRDREARELREFQELQSAQNAAALFSAKPENLRAGRTREHFDRFFIPSLTALLCVAEGFLIWWFWRKLGSAPPPPLAGKTMLVLSCFSLQALLFFVLGKYAAGLAQHEGRRLARPAASYLLLGAMLSALVAGAAAANYFNVPRADLWIARALLGLLALVAMERAVNLVLEIYRPRVKGKEAQPVYESRLLGLLSQPEGLVRTAAQTLDYQFGFKVSETWFYRYLQQAIAGLVVVQLLIIWLSSTIVILDPHEQALLERFGKPVPARPVLAPGLHFKWPWPIDRAHIYSTAEVRSFNVGFVPDPKLELENTLLWTRAHYKEEFNLLVASREAETGATNNLEQAVPVNLLTVSIPVQYRVTNLLAWARSHSAGERFLPLLATREVTRYLVSVDLEEVMASGRQRAALELRDLIQQQANAEGLGVEIMFVGLQDVHPPVQIADAYEAVVSATQERETRVLNAEAYRAETVPLAQANGQRRVLEQQASATARVAKAEAQAARFQSQRAAFHAAPAVYYQWNYHETLTAGLVLPRKFILTTTNSQQQFWLNFEEKLRTDLLDVPVPNAVKR